MPTKIGGGGKPQEYDPSNGRYGYGSHGLSSYYVKAKMILSYFPSLPDIEQSKIKMPNYSKSVTPDEKFTKYSLDETHPHGKHKAILYKKILGFTKENYKSLKNQIHRAITSGSAKLYKIEKNEYNIIKFEYHVEVTSLNGNKATIVAVYGIGPKQGKPKMITNYIK